MAKQNSNCLEFMRCPECQQTDRFKIVATSLFEMMDDGSEGHGDIEYDEDAACFCANCDWEGTIADTRALTTAEKKRIVDHMIDDCFNNQAVLRNIVEKYVDMKFDLDFYDAYCQENDLDGDVDEENDDD